MTDQPPIPLTEQNLRRELAGLRRYGLWPALVSRRLQLLTWLARQAVASDAAVLKQMASKDDRVRHEAMGTAIKDLIELAAADVPKLGDKGIPPLFGFGLPYPEKASAPKRYQAACEATRYGTEYIARDIANEWLDALASRMFERYRDYAPSDAAPPNTDVGEDNSQHSSQGSPVPEPSTEPTPRSNPTSDDVSGDDEAASKVVSSTDAARSEQPEPSLPEDNAPDASLPRRRGRRRPWISIASAIGVAVVVILLAVPGPIKDVFAGSCGPPTALFLAASAQWSGEDLGEETTVYMYTPHQEGALHGWSRGIVGYEAHHDETMYVGEMRQFALVYHNLGGKEQVVARVSLPYGSSLKSSSACVYRRDGTSTGQSYPGTSLIGGLKIGTAAEGETLAVTFDATIPPAQGLFTRLYGSIGSPSEVTEQGRSYVQF